MVIIIQRRESGIEIKQRKDEKESGRNMRLANVISKGHTE